MNDSTGEILLVGEGDFSFSVAFSKRLKCSSLVSVTSSSLLPEDELFGLHQAAPNNIEFIKNAGVKVLFEVDATKLEVNDSLRGQKFDRIIFNFPHIGGKSNIKKNRQLLKDFFKSAVGLLSPGGDILLSLCRGQGGTPVDQPVRAWHDSWQAVAMAAYSDLVLYQYTGFEPEDWPDYSCTGFRSRDQHFYTGEALTYFFRQTESVQVLDGIKIEEPVQCIVGEDLITVNRYIAEKLQRDIIHTKQHPLQCVIDELNKYLITEFGSESIHQMQYLQQKFVSHTQHLEKMVDSINSEKKTESKGSNLVKAITVEEQIIGEDSNLNVTYIESTRQHCISPYYSLNQADSSEKLRLRASLLDCESLKENIVRQSGSGKKIITAYGDVYRRTWHSPDDLPVQHEYMIVIPNTDNNLSPAPTPPSVQTRICETVKKIFQNADVFMTKCDTLPVWYNHCFEDAQCIEAGYKSTNVFHKTACNQVSAKGAPSFEQNGCKVTKLSKVIGYMGRLKPSALPLVENSTITPSTLVVLNLDYLAQIRFDIPSQSLLWSVKPEILYQFKQMSGDEKSTTFETISFFPPLWRHDLSFWEKSDETFNEQKFIDIVRDIAGDNLIEVILMNVWRDPATNKVSKCYRQVYQSLDSAICHTKAHDFQNVVRLKVAEIFGVELR